MNAKVDQEIFFYLTIGRNSLHTEYNNNGEHLDLVRFSSIKTFIRPIGQKNKTDYVLLNHRHFSDLLEIGNFRGANTDSDHFLVMAKVRARIINI